ncbi:MAG: hypothetical protein AAFR76_09795 [Planctomycetota bacterium]
MSKSAPVQFKATARYTYDLDPETRVWELNDRFLRCTPRTFGARLGISDTVDAFAAGYRGGGFNPDGRVWLFREINGDRVIVGNEFVGSGGHGVQTFELDVNSNVWSRAFEENEASVNRPFDVNIEGDKSVAALGAVGSVRIYEKFEGSWQTTDTLNTASLGGSNASVRSVTLAGDRVLPGGHQVGDVADGFLRRGRVTEYKAPTFVDGFNETFDTDGSVLPSVRFVPRRNRTTEVANGELGLRAIWAARTMDGVRSASVSRATSMPGSTGQPHPSRQPATAALLSSPSS